MPFESILFNMTNEIINQEYIDAPKFFVDLNLDQVIDHITASKQEYNLKTFYFSPLNDIDAIHYRQEIFRDLENHLLLENIKTFAEKMVLVHRHLNILSKLHYRFHQEGWFLEAAVEYCDAVICLASNLSSTNLSSHGFKEFCEYINQYTQSIQFKSLMTETKSLNTDLSLIQYSVIIKNLWVRVRKYEDEIDYSKKVEETFEKFKQGGVKNYKVDLRLTSGMNHVEAQILDCVVKLFPETFKELDQFCVKYDGFLDEKICGFDREIQFYVAYLEFISSIKKSGVKFCYPKITTQKKEIHSFEAFDIALANKIVSEDSTIICNDFYLKGKERIIVVSGPNQGGKTTFARMFGQLHYLASLGCPVPGRAARLFLYDQMFTHFEKEEDIRSLRGKLKDDLVRIHSVLNQATPNSIIIINEILTSTALKDAVFLSKQIMDKIIHLDSLCVCVSFIDELSTLSEKTVSMMSTIVPENPALRTFKIIRKPADGLSYAICIAEKHHLTYNLIKERIVK